MGLLLALERYFSASMCDYSRCAAHSFERVRYPHTDPACCRYRDSAQSSRACQFGQRAAKQVPWMLSTSSFIKGAPVPIMYPGSWSTTPTAMRMPFTPSLNSFPHLSYIYAVPLREAPTPPQSTPCCFTRRPLLRRSVRSS